MDNLFHQPQGGNEMPRFAGRATMMRLPFIEDLQGLDAAFVGIPLDIGTSQRSGTRYGPRYIRAESVMIRPYNMATGAAPFDSLSVADIGDVPINTYSLLKSVQIIEDYYTGLNSYPLIPLTLGGDHTITLPILRALTKNMVRWASSTSTPIPTPMMRCSERKSPTAPPSAAPLRRDCSTSNGWCRLASAPGAMPPATSSGALTGLSPGAGGAVLAYLAGAADGRSPPADGRRAGVSQL